MNNPEFHIVDGDYSKFDGIEINGHLHNFQSEFERFFWNIEKDWERNFEINNDKSLIESKRLG